MRRVVVTGMGIVSPIGNSVAEVLPALRGGRSGITFVPEMEEVGLRCRVAGRVRGLDTAKIGKRTQQTMSAVTKYAAVATLEAIEDAKVSLGELRSGRAGVIVGTAWGGINEVPKAEEILRREKSPRLLGATGAVKIMTSTAALNLATWLGVKGRCYSVSSACATGTENIGFAYELIRHGVLDLCVCGGAEETWIGAAAFLENMALTPVDFNDRPEEACRPYDRGRQGIVIAEGAGILFLEALDSAHRRGARIYAEVIGYGSANEGSNMFEPKGPGLKRAIEQALSSASGANNHLHIDYINPHGAGTKVGDPVEVRVLREIFGAHSPLVSSTKALSGHAQSATGAHEAIFTLLMLHHGFVVPTKNLDQIAPECEGIQHVQSLMDTPLQTVMSFNAGLGGTNACLIFKKL